VSLAISWKFSLTEDWLHAPVCSIAKIVDHRVTVIYALLGEKAGRRMRSAGEPIRLRHTVLWCKCLAQIKDGASSTVDQFDGHRFHMFHMFHMFSHENQS
jgi:hypothetical protein